MKFILEYSDFSRLQLGPQPYNPKTSIEGYDRYKRDIESSNTKLLSILNKIKIDNLTGLTVNSLNFNISKLTILNIENIDNVDVNIYFRCIVDDEEYYGNISNYINNPKLDIEVLKMFNFNYKETLRIKGYITNIIDNFFKVEVNSIWESIIDFTAISTINGKEIKLHKNTTIKIVSYNKNNIIFNFLENEYKITNINVIYFKYRFIEKK